MSKYILTLLLSFCVVAVHAQATYYVSVVKGKVSKTGGALLKSGDKLTITDKITFTSKTDQLILLNPGSGRLLLSPQNGSGDKGNSLSGSIKDFLDLSSKQQRLSANTKKPADSIRSLKRSGLMVDSMKSMMSGGQ